MAFYIFPLKKREKHTNSILSEPPFQEGLQISAINLMSPLPLRNQMWPLTVSQGSQLSAKCRLIKALIASAVVSWEHFTVEVFNMGLGRKETIS